MKKYLRLALIVILLIALAAAAEHFMPGLLGGLADGLPSGASRRRLREPFA